MNIKKLENGKFLLVIKSLGVEKEYNSNKEAWVSGLDILSKKELEGRYV